MPNLIFPASEEFTIGVELEIQIIDPKSLDLTSRSKDILRDIRHLIKNCDYPWQIKPEVTESMIEVNSSIHKSPKSLLIELLEIRDFLVRLSEHADVYFSGGGTHPFQKWSARKIFPSPRYKTLSTHYGYLAKRFTAFGQHIHIGCKSGDDAIYLIHALSRYVPHFIALSAASPFYQGADTLFASSRNNIASSFPLSGFLPFVQSWKGFNRYFTIMHDLNIVENMRDFYWDIRPKPEFGTVEIRVCDTPLTIEKAVALAAYAQTLCRYILRERPFTINKDIYMLYNCNRFQACRYGLDGIMVDPYTLKKSIISDDILETLKILKPHTSALHNQRFLATILASAKTKENDATWIHSLHKQVKTLKNVVKIQSSIWKGDL